MHLLNKHELSPYYIPGSGQGTAFHIHSPVTVHYEITWSLPSQSLKSCEEDKQLSKQL